MKFLKGLEEVVEVGGEDLEVDEITEEDQLVVTILMNKGMPQDIFHFQEHLGV